MSTPRGIRNNNPGNIEKGANWKGLVKPGKDKRFCEFVDAPHGIRAIAVILKTYQDKHGINTVGGVINRWAPPHENNTKAYATHMRKKLGVEFGAEVNVHDWNTMKTLVRGIIKHENGQVPYSYEEIEEGLRLAGIKKPRRSVTESRTAKAAAVAGVAQLVSTTHDTLAPTEGIVPGMEYILAGLVVIGAGFAIYFKWEDIKKGLN